MRRAMRQSRTIELRLDWLKSPRELERFVAQLRLRGKKACAIATLRRRNAGGRFYGGRKEQFATLAAAIAAGCSWCDLEIESAEGNRDEVRELQQKFGIVPDGHPGRAFLQRVGINAP